MKIASSLVGRERVLAGKLVDGRAEHDHDE